MTSDDFPNGLHRMKVVSVLAGLALDEVEKIVAADTTTGVGEIHRNLQRVVAFSKQEVERRAKHYLIGGLVDPPTKEKVG